MDASQATTDASPATTPPQDQRTHPDIDVLKDTPQNRGSASNAAYKKHYTHKDYHTYIMQDLQKEVELSFDDYMKIILGFETGRWEERESELHTLFQAVVENKDLKTQLGKYSSQADKEEDRYQSFSRFWNLAIELLGGPNWKHRNKESSVVCCRNDPCYISGSLPERKPDFVLVYEADTEAGDRISTDSCSLHGPCIKPTYSHGKCREPKVEEWPFHWAHLKSFVENAMVRHCLYNKDGKTLEASIIPHKPEPKDHENPELLAAALPREPSLGGVMTRSQTQAAGLAMAEAEEFEEGAIMSEPIDEYAISLSVNTPLRSISDSYYIISSDSRKRRSDTELSGTEYKKRRAVTKQQQCASYGLEMLTHGGLRTHAIGVLVTDDMVKLLYYDRSIPIVSEQFSIISDPMKFMAVLYAMRELDASGWGYEPRLTRANYHDLTFRNKMLKGTMNNSKTLFHGSELQLSNGWTLELNGELFHQPALIGRGTCVVEAKYIRGADNDPETVRWRGTPSNTYPLVVKFSYVPSTRLNESDIVRQLTDLAKKGETEYLDYLPHIVHSESTPPQRVQKALSQHLGSECYESRELRITVQEKLSSIKKFREERHWNNNTVHQIFKDIFKCYRWVYEQGKVIHRDISIDNLMVRKVSGRFRGVLNDFDLAIPLNRTSGPTSQQRTGTRPFMARIFHSDPNPVHAYRHDLESLLYCTQWVIAKDITEQVDGKPVQRNPLVSWYHLTDDELDNKKGRFLEGTDKFDPYPIYEGFYKKTISLGTIINRWYQLRSTRMRDGWTQDKAVPPSDEPSDDGLTFDAFESKLF